VSALALIIGMKPRRDGSEHALAGVLFMLCIYQGVPLATRESSEAGSYPPWKQEDLTGKVNQPKDSPRIQLEVIMRKSRRDLDTKEPPFLALTTLAHQFREKDFQGNGHIDPDNFIRVLQSQITDLHSEDAQVVATAYRRPGDSWVGFMRFFNALYPWPISWKRRQMVQDIFKGFNGGKDIHLPTLLEHFKGDHNVLTDFKANVGSKRTEDTGIVTMADFVRYYSVISPKMKTDEEFQSELQKEWPSPSDYQNMSGKQREEIENNRKILKKPYTKHMTPFDEDPAKSGGGLMREHHGHSAARQASSDAAPLDSWQGRASSGNPFGSVLTTSSESLQQEMQKAMDASS